MKDLEYRRKQLKQLQEEVIDLEEVNGNVSLTDFTLDDFRMDLINLQEKYDSEVENTPLGIYSIVKNNNKSLDDEIKPGVIYCLKRADSYKNESDKNPIYPQLPHNASSDTHMHPQEPDHRQQSPGSSQQDFRHLQNPDPRRYYPQQ